MGVTADHDSNNPNLRDLMKTSLSLFVGETVVVGSSTTPATEASLLLLLLTAEE